MTFLLPNHQHQSTEGTNSYNKHKFTEIVFQQGFGPDTPEALDGSGSPAQLMSRSLK